MKLESVHVRNFKTLEDLTIDFTGFYTAISGKNNAGKTNLISVLRQVFKDQLRE
jgi:predicted ATP-dependent endonuclease of OLD family